MLTFFKKAKSYKIINFYDFFQLILVFILNLLSILFEFISIAIIPLFLAFILKFNIDSSNFLRIFEIYADYFSITLTNESIVFIILSIFFFKSLIVTYMHYVEVKLFSGINLKISKYLYNILLSKDYKYHVDQGAPKNIWLMQLIDEVMVNLSHRISFMRNIIIIFFIFFFISFYEINNYSYYIFFIIFIFILLYFFISNKLKILGKKFNIYDYEVKKLLKESFSGIKTLLAYKAQKFFLDKFYYNKNIFFRSSNSSFFFAEFPKYYLEFIGVCFVLGLSFTLISQGKSSNDILLITASFSYAFLRIFSVFKSILSNFSNIKRTSFAYKNFITFFNVDELYKNKIKNNWIKTSFISKRNITIILKNVNFSYNNFNSILKDINLEIEKNKVYGIFGSSGSGKSTLLDIISGLRMPDSGEILISQDKRQLKYIPQENFILDSTIISNVAFSVKDEDIDINRVKNVLKVCGLSSLLESGTEGLNNILGDNGLKISGGQRQRINIARALYFKPKILVMDEPFSSVDLRTSLEIMDLIRKLSKNLTIILSSHTKEIINLCDFHYYLKNTTLKKVNKVIF
jgi:ABC-type multidrug transport system fused ATPase/permease subunit